MKFFLKYFVLSFIIFTLLFTAGIALYDRFFPKSTEDEIETLEGLKGTDFDVPLFVQEGDQYFDAFTSKDRVNVLLFGVAQGMTDTIMIASFDMENKFIDLISVPRDTYYARPGRSGASLKINAVYNSEGLVPFAEAVSKTLHGIPLNYYIAFTYDGVEQIVDSMGGVPMNVPKALKYSDPTDKPPLYINIPAGEQILDGEHAVQFLRFRGYSDADLGRVKAQQEFMKSAMKQALSLRLPVVAATVLKNVESSISSKDAAKLISKAIGIRGDSIETHLMPNKLKSIDGLSFVGPIDAQITDMIEEIYYKPGKTAVSTDGAITE